MGFTTSLKTFAFRILSCCDEEPPTPRRALVIGTPYDFTHVSSPSILSSGPTSPTSSLHSSHKDLAEKSSLANLSHLSKPSQTPSYSADTGIDAFLANRRLGGSTTSRSTTTSATSSSVQAHVRQLSGSRQCSACSAGEGMGGVQLDGAAEGEGIVVHIEEVEGSVETGSLRPEDLTDDEDEAEAEAETKAEEAVQHEVPVAAPLNSRKPTRSMRKLSIAASLRTNGIHDDEEDDDGDAEDEHDVVLIEEVAKAVSMKRYGFPDLLTELTPEKRR